jgi:hypothetical protein
MRRRLKRQQKPDAVRNGHQTRWFWTDPGLQVQQLGWLGIREYDGYHPASHYNLHIQPAWGRIDYHNYHIRYMGVKEGQHIWSVVDAPYGKEKSHRIYAFPKERFIQEAIDTVNSLLVTDLTNDIGDTSLWIRLFESLEPVLLDLYQNE